MDVGKAINKLRNAITGVETGPDGYPLDPKSLHYASDCLVNEFLAEVPDFRCEYQIKPAAYATGKRILEAAPEERIALVEAMLVRRVWVHQHDRHSSSFGILRKLIGLLWRRELPYTTQQAAALLAILSAQMSNTHWFDDDLNAAVKICERLKGKNELEPLREPLQKLKGSMKTGIWESAERKRIRAAIDRLLLKDPPPPLDPGEAWSNVALEDLKAMAPAESAGWVELFLHCQKADAPRPTQKWAKTAKELVESVGREVFKNLVLRWFELVALPRPVHREPEHPNYSPDPDQLITDQNSMILKGLVWCCAEWQDKEIVRGLSRLAQVCFKKVRNLGARCPRVGNACLYSLSATSTEEAAAELTRLDQVVKQASTKKLINKSLDKAAEMTGLTRADLEESTVPSYGLDVEGCLKRSFGVHTAEFRISGPDAFELLWRKADGKLQKSVPAEVKEKHAADLKSFKRTIQDIEKMLPAHRHRIERLLSSGREWEFEKWRERYLDHPLLAHLNRRLIWHFREGERQSAGIWREGVMVDNENRPLDWISPATRVRPWHPLGQPVETVRSWRQWLETHQVTQPFKQAHREIYILTEAEQQTGTYSNRFAAHVIRQHQFAALARERGWTYRLQGAFDSHNVPTLLLPQWDTAVEFWVESPGGHEGTSDSGIYLHLSTDQVRFCDQTGQPRQLSEVPALVFSEVMRDVDLFVGVCSVGNDPEWHDRGEAGPFGGYWYRYAFGDLSANAVTRREVLERLLPRLKIAGQCALRDKFLVVQGSLRTYKIHLGSGNILMEPNDRYLCIVPARGMARPYPDEKVFLPFEGDNTLAVILSKAFLLAEDAKIKDSGIMSQIKG
jgi:hypothetical protein